MEFVISIPSGPRFDPRLRYCLASLRVQKPDVKVALCDVSQDARCVAMAAQYSDIIDYTRHGDDLGQSNAINEGWKAVTGDIYGWLNVDDYLAPNALERVEQLFYDCPDIDVIFGQSLILEGEAYIGLHNEVRPISRELFKTNIISQPSCFVRRKALFETGLLNEGLHYTMDWDLWVRLYENGAKFHYIPEVLSTVVWDAFTKTSDFNKRRYKEIIAITRRHGSLLSSQRTALSFFIDHAAQYGWAKPIAKKLLSHVRKKNNVPERRWTPVLDGLSESLHGPVDIIIPLFHYDPDTQFSVALEFTNTTPRELSIVGVEPILSHTFTTALIAEIIPGKTELLRVKSDSGNISDLRSVTISEAP